MSGEAAFDEQVELAVGRALACLARRDHSVEGIRGRLRKRGFQPDVIEGAVARLVEMEYLDDEAFARRFAEDRRRLDSWGDQRIRERLIQLGVGREAIALALADCDDGAELERAIQLLDRRLERPADGQPERRRAIGILVRRGYSLELASDAIREHRRSAS